MASPRKGGLLGRDGVAAALVEAGAKRFLGVDLNESLELTERLVEATGENRMLSVLNRRLGRLALNLPDKGALRGQDDDPEQRIAIAQKVREVADRNAMVQLAVRLRNAFCFGTGVSAPKAPDPDVQDLLDDLWNATPNKAEFSTPEAQWRTGSDLWKNCNYYPVVYAGLSAAEGGRKASALDGRVLVASLQHDLVVDVVRDPERWARVLYYRVVEHVYEYDYAKHAVKPNPTKRHVYYEAFDGMAELEEEVAAGRTSVPPAPPAAILREGRVLHLAINRGKEQAFGQPELRTVLRFAAGFVDIALGQVEKAKSAQSYLMKIRAKGARTRDQLEDLALRTVGRRSAMSTAPLDMDAASDGQPARRGAPGGQWWENEALEAEPFALDSGAASAKQDLESVSMGLAAGTNYPGHYLFGEPGSLAGGFAVELPVLKLTEIDQEYVRSKLLATLCDLRIARAREVGILSDRRKLTEDELAEGRKPDADGMVERDFSYELRMPDPLRRNVPELMSLISDAHLTFAAERNRPLRRALLGYTLELLEMSDAPALLESVMAAYEATDEADRDALDATMSGGGPEDRRVVGPDGKRHPTDNAYGARRRTAGMIESALRATGDPEAAEVLTALAHVLEQRVANGNGAEH